MARTTTTTIQLREETKAELDKVGKKGDTYDDIVNILLVVYKTQKMIAK